MNRAVLFLTLFCAAVMNAQADDWERWRDGRRVLLVRTSPHEVARWREQAVALSESRKDLEERDVQVVVWEGDGTPSEWPACGKIPFASPFARRFPDLHAANWRVALVGRDGGVKAVWSRVVAADEVFAQIDAMPMGRLEKEERRKKERCKSH